MNMLDLFSGIGGFHLAAEWVWGADLNVVAHVEIEPFCQKVLNKHWPDVPIISDIRDVTNETLANSNGKPNMGNKPKGESKSNGRSKNFSCWGTGLGLHPENEIKTGEEDERIMAYTKPPIRPSRKTNELLEEQSGKTSSGITGSCENRRGEPRIDLLTGGFPCQPFSCAGKRQGENDDRFLWPEMLRVIREIQPTYIIGENVAGIINLALDQVLSELEEAGYSVQAFIIPACAVDAPHRRDRVWIVATRLCDGRNGGETEVGKINNQGNNGTPSGEKPMVNDKGLCTASTKGIGQDVADNDRPGLQNRQSIKAKSDQRSPINGSCGARWFPEPNVGRVANGVPSGLDIPARWEPEPDIPRVATGVPDRVNRLKALGNSIVPQVVVPIMQAIKEIG